MLYNGDAEIGVISFNNDIRSQTKDITFTRNYIERNKSANFSYHEQKCQTREKIGYTSLPEQINLTKFYREGKAAFGSVRNLQKASWLKY